MAGTNHPQFDHPCFSNADVRAARMHLAVAPRCNIRCSFCNPQQGDSCVHGCIPGLTKQVLRPDEALAHVRNVIFDRGIDIKIIGIAGPGEPLFNAETFETLALVRRHYPQIHLCLSTNGLLLPEKAQELAALGVETITVTVNCVREETAEKVYEHVEGKRERADFARLLHNQWEGIEKAVAAGLCVKVNSVLLPGENEEELPEVARRAKAAGAYIHNVLPLIPRADAQKRCAPGAETVERVRNACAAELVQFERCRHCRADAIIDIPDYSRE